MDADPVPGAIQKTVGNVQDGKFEYGPGSLKKKLSYTIILLLSFEGIYLRIFTGHFLSFLLNWNRYPVPDP